MKYFLFFLIPLFSFSQKIDTIIDVKGFYKVYYNYQLKDPIYTTEVLYRAGGNIDRNQFRFLNDIPSIKTSRNVDFNNTNYDRGHLVPAEDMAYDTAKIEATFRWYNVVPQYNTFNRYDWLTWAERKTREFVKKDSVYVITGCIFDSVVRALKPDSVAIPRRMYKLVQSLRTKQILYIVICNNNSKPNCREIKIAELDRLRKYPIPILK